MNKIWKWLNRPKKDIKQVEHEAENPQTCSFPVQTKSLSLLLVELGGLQHRASNVTGGWTVVMETLNSTPQMLATLPFNLRDLDGRMISQTRLDRSDPDLILTTRLSMLRELLQRHISQEEQHTATQQPSCLEHLRTTSAWSPQTSALPPAFRLRERATEDTSASCSLPSSPHPGGRRGLTYSLPCSPLLGGRRRRSPPSSPSPPSGLSRHWVEAALQRSKNIRQAESCPPAPRPPQVRQVGEREGRCSPRGETKEEEDVLCLETLRYCQLTPCVFFRCPSAPPYEAEVFSARDIQAVSALSSEDQKHSEGLTQLSLMMSFLGPDIHRSDIHRLDVQKSDVHTSDVQRSEGDREQSLHRDRVLQQSATPRVYSSLSLWKITAGQTELNRKQGEEVNSLDSFLIYSNIESAPHANNIDDHLQWLRKIISGELLTSCSVALSFILQRLFDSTTCTKRTAHPAELCSLWLERPAAELSNK